MNQSERERTESSGSDPNLPKTAFVSTHIDLSCDVFLLHYRNLLDVAIANGDYFILSTAGGAASMALEYLLSHNVSAAQITIYLHVPPVRRQKRGGANETMRRIDRLGTTPDALEHYRKQGFGVRVINGGHTERDTAMTRESDYDILWVRPDDETKTLYGKRYRPGRVSGTQKNKDRREQLEKGEENVVEKFAATSLSG